MQHECSLQKLSMEMICRDSQTRVVLGDSYQCNLNPFNVTTETKIKSDGTDIKKVDKNTFNSDKPPLAIEKSYKDKDTYREPKSNSALFNNDFVQSFDNKSLKRNNSLIATSESDLDIVNSKTDFQNHKARADSVPSEASTADANSLLESDLICDFTEPQHLTMTIRRPENILKLLSENEDGQNASVNAIIRSQKDASTPSESSSKVLTSQEFCKYLKSYKLTIKPFGAAKSKKKKTEAPKTNYSTVSRWRCAINRPKPKPSKLKWHHTNFEDKPKTPPMSTPPYVTSLAQAYQDLVTRDLALEELKTTPEPSMFVTRKDDPCLISTSEEENPDLQFFANPQSEKRIENTKAEADSPLNLKIDEIKEMLPDKECETILKHTWEIASPLRKRQKHRSGYGSLANENRSSHKQSTSNRSSFERDSAKPKTNKKTKDMETLEMQSHVSYAMQQQGPLQPGIMTSPIFPEMDLPITTDDILSADDHGLFDDPNGFMKEFFTDPSLVISADINSCNKLDYYKPTDPQDPLAIATSSIMSPVTQELAQHVSPMMSPMERTPSYELQTSYVSNDEYSSSDSGIHSPESMTSPMSDVCPWTTNDAEMQQNFFTYAVASHPYSPTRCTVPDNAPRQATSCSPEPQLWNLDQNISESLPQLRVESNAPIYTQISSAHFPIPIQQVSNASICSQSIKHTTSTPPAEAAPRTPEKCLSPVTPKPINSKPKDKLKQPSKGKNAILWEFIRDILLDPAYCPSLIKWEDKNTGLFRFVQSDVVAAMWGKKKRNPKMNYEKLSRAMRYYYNRGILDRVDGRRLVYKFGVNAHGWKKNSELQSPVQTNATLPSPATSPVAESKMVSVSWLDAIESPQTTNVQFPSQESNNFSAIEARSTSGQLVSLPSASVLLPKWETIV